MGSKIALILSLFFVSLFFLLGGDLISIQFIYSDLDSKGVTISYLLSKTGRVDDAYRSELEEKYKVKITYQTKDTPRFGDVLSFDISKDFKPIVISNDYLTLKVQRTAIIGYYG